MGSHLEGQALFTQASKKIKLKTRYQKLMDENISSISKHILEIHEAFKAIENAPGDDVLIQQGLKKLKSFGEFTGRLFEGQGEEITDGQGNTRRAGLREDDYPAIFEACFHATRPSMEFTLKQLSSFYRINRLRESVKQQHYENANTDDESMLYTREANSLGSGLSIILSLSNYTEERHNPNLDKKPNEFDAVYEDMIRIETMPEELCPRNDYKEQVRNERLHALAEKADRDEFCRNSQEIQDFARFLESQTQKYPSRQQKYQDLQNRFDNHIIDYIENGDRDKFLGHLQREIDDYQNSGCFIHRTKTTYQTIKDKLAESLPPPMLDAARQESLKQQLSLIRERESTLTADSEDDLTPRNASLTDDDYNAFRHSSNNR